MSDVRVVLGMQGLQMPANALRGIGRWCTEYSLALARISPETIVALSVDEELPLPSVASHFLSLGVPVLPAAQPPSDLGSRRLVFHVLSPLEDLPIERVWPKWARDPGVGLVATIYDMIPMLFPDDYFQGALKRLLQVRYEIYRQAAATIGISQTTVDDAVGLLGLDRAGTFVVAGGVASRFVPHDSGRTAALRALAQFGLRDDFLLTIGNVDPRKNLTSLMEAYSQMAAGRREKHQLVITCSQADQHHLGALRLTAERFAIADTVVILPHVDDEVMVRLYQSCALMIYPSLYEGLGLPIIEAQACGAATLVSDVGPMREIVSEPEARFDPTSPPAIRDRIEFALSNPAFLDRLRAKAVQDAARYSWGHGIDAALTAYRRAG